MQPPIEAVAGEGWEAGRHPHFPLAEGLPAGPDRWRARLARVSDGEIEVAYRGAVLLVPPASSREFAGLTNCPVIAAGIARATGGRLYENEAPAPSAGVAPAVYATLLLATLCVLVSAWRRRRA